MKTAGTLRPALVALLATVLLGATPGDFGAWNARAQDSSPQAAWTRGAVEPITLHVANHNWLDIKVYAVRDGQRTRLGTVVSNGRERFRLPPHLLADVSGIRFLAVTLGGLGEELSPAVYAGPGDDVVWTVENHLPNSTIQVIG